MIGKMAKKPVYLGYIEKNWVCINFSLHQWTFELTDLRAHYEEINNLFVYFNFG